MSPMWLKYTLQLSQEVEEEFTTALLESHYTLGWIEPAIEITVTENGYDYTEQVEQPLRGYVFEPLQGPVKEAVQQFQRYIANWNQQVQLIAHEQVEEENESWKDEFQPVQIGEWIIAPSWTSPDELPDTSHVMWIDPGAAFGTGYHVTTQDSITFLQGMDLRGKQVLDIGVGSGILSLFCLKFGSATPVIAIDLNPEAEWQISQNLALNHLPKDSISVIIGDPLTENLLDAPLQADVVLVNIGGEEIIGMLPVIKSALKMGGTAILSGIVTWNQEKVCEAFTDAGFEVIASKSSNEWVTLVTKL